MKRKQFLQVGSTLVWGSAFGTFTGCKAPLPRTRNWAGNIEYSTGEIIAPQSLDDITHALQKVKQITAQGTCHCFNRIADSNDQLLAMRGWNKVVELDKARGTVTVEAGMKYGELAPYIDQYGFALHNLASLPHISVAGSVATATHGSGVLNGNLATAVTALEFVDGSGKLVQLDREKDGEQFMGAVVALGALGIVTQVTFQVQPSFRVRQYVFERLPLDQLYANFEAIMGAGYSVSLFTDWQQNSVNEIWIKSRSDAEQQVDGTQHFFGATPATRNMHPIAANSAENCTPQLGVEGPWYERLPHFKMGFTPSSGVELQAEYFLPLDKAVEGMKAVATLAGEIGPHLFISEIRTIASDDLWMSTAYKRHSVAIHFTWKQETEAVMALLPRIEKALEPFEPRPHWGKLFTIPKSALEVHYERMKDFRLLARQFDPQGKFRNAFLADTIF